jgi:fructose/tagatose bisphosphate aldolase
VIGASAAFDPPKKNEFSQHPEAKDPRQYIVPGKLAMKEVVAEKSALVTEITPHRPHRQNTH